MEISVELQESFYIKVEANWEDILNRALDEICQEYVYAIKNEAPVDTGALRDGIKLYIDDHLEKHITSDMYYWIYVNYGTYKMAANPFVDRGIEDVQSSGLVDAAIERALQSAGVIG